jgi:hypothetical protein
VANNKNQQSEVLGFLGLGLDNKDGHQRLTRTDSFLLVGGSKDTHEKMQDFSIRFNESLEERGKLLHEATLEEILELMHQAMERQ